MKKVLRPITRLQILLHILAFAFFGAAVIRAATSYQVNTGSIPTVTEFGVCKVITNTSGKNLFIPTNSSGEWSSFYNNPPSGVTVATCDTTPDAFNFSDQTSINLSTGVSSNILQITGINTATPTSISGNGGQYRICNDGSCSSIAVNWTTAGSSITNNQYIQLSQTSSGSFSTQLSTTLTVGSGSDTWYVTTRAANSCSLPWGGSIGHGASVTAYQASSVSCVLSCVSETRTCTDGSLSGSYQYSSCSVNACQQYTQTFTSNGTWTRPPGVNSVTVTMVGGGGGGGGGDGGSGGGGGGGGAQAITNQTVSVSGDVSVTVGAGGASGPALYSGHGNGGNGGSSAFGGLSVSGGSGGNGAQENHTGGSGGNGGGGAAGGSYTNAAGGAAGSGSNGGGGGGGGGYATCYPAGGGGGPGAAGNNCSAGGAGGGGGGNAGNVGAGGDAAGGGGGASVYGNGGVGGRRALCCGGYDPITQGGNGLGYGGGGGGGGADNGSGVGDGGVGSGGYVKVDWLQ